MDEGSEGLSISIATTKAAQGEAFLSALSSQLEQMNKETGESSFGLASEGNSESSSRFKREAQAYYYYSKILYDSRQAPGAALAEFFQTTLSSSTELAKSVEEQAQPLGICKLAVDRLCRLLEQHANELSRSQPSKEHKALLEFLPWVRPSVERCVYMRVGLPMWRRYQSLNSREDTIYREKVASLRSASDAVLLAALDIRPEFRGGAAPTSSSSSRVPKKAADAATAPREESALEAGADSFMTPSTAGDADEARSGTTSEGCRSIAGASWEGPYERAILALSQLEVAFSSGKNCLPREAIEALTLSQLEMKTCALEMSDGKAELCSMDDILPVFIFILVRSSLLHPFACARFISDSLSQDERLESEGRAVLLLNSAAQHVALHWEVSGLVSQGPGLELSPNTEEGSGP